MGTDATSTEPLATADLQLLEPLQERVDDWRGQDSQVNVEDRIVRNIALAGLISRNGYRYTPEALQAAVPLYEQRPVFLDHAPQGARPQQRSTRDLVGTIRQARFEQDRIRGDIHVLKTPAAQTFLALVEANTVAVGMSHVVLASRSADQSRVEHIEEVISVDVVVFPATTVTFQEQLHQTEPGLPELPDSLELSESLESLELSPVSAEPSAASDPWKQRYLRLARKYVELQRRRLQEQRVEHLLTEAALPPLLVTETFRRQLLDADNETRQQELIHERRQLWSALERRLPLSQPRSLPEQTLQDNAFVHAIRRRA